MSGGGALSADVTLNALVTSVFGRTGAVTLTAADISTGGGVPATRQILTATGSGLAGGGPLSADLNLSIVNDTSIQRVNWASGTGSIAGTRSTLNFIAGTNISVALADNPGANRTDVTITGSGVTAISSGGTLIGNRPGINFISGSNVTITASDNSSQNRVDITISAVGGTGGGASQTPWLGPVDAAGNPLANVSLLGVNRTTDSLARIAVQTTSTEIGVRVASNSTTNAATLESDNDNATAKVQLAAYGSGFGGSLQATGGLNATAGAMTFAIAGAEAMRVSTGKRILLGTSTDDGANLLQVNGNLKILTTGNGVIFPDGTKQTTAITSTGMTDPTTTLGDLIVRGSAVTGRLGVGANNQVLTADSTAPVGVKWAAVPSVYWQPGSGGAIYYNGGNVGIGTTSPSYNLQIHVATNQNFGFRFGPSSTASMIAINDVGSAYTPMALDGYPIILNTSSAGNVGIGTTNPSYLLDVIGAASQFRLANSAVTASIVSSIASGSGAALQFVNGNFSAAGAIGNSGPGNAPTNDLLFLTYLSGGSWTERMRITNAGNVGIGTNNPNYALVVTAPSATVPAAIIGNPSVNLQLGQMVDGVGPAINSQTWQLALQTGGVTRIAITTSGNVGIGTTSPGYQLDVQSANYSIINAQSNSASGAVLQINATNGGHAWWLMATAASSSQGPNRFVLYDNTASAARLTVDSSGNVGIGTTSPSGLLHVKSTGAFDSYFDSGGALRVFIQSGASNTQWALHNSYYASNSFGIHDVTHNTDPFCISSSGNVGIGTTSPTAQLHVTSTATIGGAYVSGNYGLNAVTGFYVHNAGNGPSISINTWTGISSGPSGGGMWAQNAYMYETNNLSYFTNAHSSIGACGIVLGGYPVSSNQIGFFTNVGPSTALAQFTPNLRMRIQDTGSILIGASAYDSGVAGDLCISRTATPTTGAIFFGSGASYLYYNGSIWNFTPALNVSTLAAGSAGQVLTTVSGVPTWSTPASSGTPGAWTAYTPTVKDGSCTTLTFSSVFASYLIYGTVMFYQASFVIAAGYTTATITVSLPSSVLGNNMSISCHVVWGAGSANQCINAVPNGANITVTTTVPGGSSTAVYLGGTIRIS